MRPELTEAATLLRDGTAQSLDQAVALLQNTVFSFSMKVCGHREDAEDTMQDVLLGSLKHLIRFREPEQLAAWLYTVTRNRCRRMRRAPAGLAQPALSLDELMPAGQELARLLRASNLSPEADVLAAESHQMLHTAVLTLPPALRLVLVLHDMEELDTDLVARILDLKPGTVRVRLHRARLALRHELARQLTRQPASEAATASETAPRPAACRELFASLSEYLDERLDTSRMEQMSTHIAACPACVVFLTDLRRAIDRCRAFSIGCDPAVLARMRSLIATEMRRLSPSRSAL